MRIVLVAFSLLSLTTTVLTVWTYLFPLWRGCTFPTKDYPYTPWLGRRVLNGIQGEDHELHPEAEFRLLAFGDPQLEGDTSIWRPDDNALYRPSVLSKDLGDAETIGKRIGLMRNATRDLITQALPSQLAAWRKRIDLLGNDYYLAHIYRAVYRATSPTHVTVLGDLLGSQWIEDEEFRSRSWRYWNRVFRGGVKVENATTRTRTEETLGSDGEWPRRIINVVGNHDIGYAGDITEERVGRFERAFGDVNWEIIFHHPQKHEPTGTHPTLHLVILNSMNLDAPAKSYELQMETYGFINRVIGELKPVEDRTVGTVLLTHIPLHKEQGVCVDGPFFAYHGQSDGWSIQEQNHLSYDAGRGAVLEGLYGMSGNTEAPYGGLGRDGLILNGHDHHGCDTYHYLPTKPIEDEDQTRTWNVTRYENAKQSIPSPIPGIREVTLRAMMGEFGGFAYMISAWFDFEAGSWRFEVNRCSAGVQHWWWATHIAILVTLGVGGAILVSEFSPKTSIEPETRDTRRTPRAANMGVREDRKPSTAAQTGSDGGRRAMG
jgi:hypothetical protein